MKDLSHLVKIETTLNAGESMSAGNTINHLPLPGVGAPGSDPVNPLPELCELDTPQMEIPPVKGPTVLITGNGTPTHKKAGE